MADQRWVRAWRAVKPTNSKKALEKALALKIIVVDDISTILTISHGVLKKAGFTDVHTYKNPVEAAEDYSSFKPAIVITDLEMPEMHGSNLIARIAKESGSKPPRFIIRSGNALPEEGSTLGRIIERFKVTYSQKGAYGFENVVKRTALAVVKGIPPKPETLPAGRASVSELANNPFKLFLSKIAHKMNNLIALFAYLDLYKESSPNAEKIRRNILRAFRNFFVFTSALRTFLAKDLSRAKTFSDTGLPKTIDSSGHTQKAFFSIPAEQRQKFAVIVNQYCNNEQLNLSGIAAEIGGLQEYLLVQGINKTTVSAVYPKIKGLMKQISDLNLAVAVSEAAPQDLATLFTNYYLELARS